MELVATLPTDLLTIADPTARGSAPLLRPPDQDTEPGVLAAPFELLLGLFGAPLPSGEILPPGGNGLPVSAAPPSDAGTVLTVAAAEAPPQTTDAALLARLRLTAGDGAGSPWTSSLDPPADSSLVDTASASDSPPAPLPPGATSVPAVTESPQSEQLAAAVEAALGNAPAGDARAQTLENSKQRTVRDTPHARTLAAASLAESTVAPGDNDLPAAVSAAVAQLGAGRAALDKSAHRGDFVQPLAVLAAADDGGAPIAADAPTTGVITAPSAQTASGAQAAASAGLAPSHSAHGGAVDTGTPNWHDAFASRVQWLVDQHVGEAHIKLNPPELGAVDVKISLVDDKTFVQLTAHSASARDELTQSLPRLRELLATSGLELGGASVQGGHGGHGGHGNQGGADSAPRSASLFRGLAPFADEVEPLHPATRAAGRIDLFA